MIEKRRGDSGEWPISLGDDRKEKGGEWPVSGPDTFYRRLISIFNGHWSRRVGEQES